MARLENSQLESDRQERILDAVLKVLAEFGIAGLSIRAVAREADVALGLVNYHYKDKHHLICAALRRIEQRDLALLESTSTANAKEKLLSALRSIASSEFTNHDYLMLRMQVWSLAQVHEDFAQINKSGHERYRAGLAKLIKDARPELSQAAARSRADDIDLVQNGIWLTTFLGLDKSAITRAVKETERIAFS